ncbi:MAG: hypothetical protein GEU94_10610 [Micromonosporaceae bacterium]|nr:hypothetical protein [Micromonosporaceae bacterium]
MEDSGVGIVDQRFQHTDALPRFQTASGAIVAINAPGYDLSQPWFHSFHVKVEAPYGASAPSVRNRAFQVAPVGTVDTFVEYDLRGKIVEELSALGGRLLIARNHEGRGIAAWRGRWHEVYIWLNEPGFTAREVLDQYDRLAFADSPLGVRVRTSQSPKETIYREEVGKSVPNVAHLTIVDGGQALELLPKWSGAKVRSGEVWQKQAPASDGGLRKLFVHASSSAVTVLDDIDPSDPDSKRLGFLDGLVSLTWTRS